MDSMNTSRTTSPSGASYDEDEGLLRFYLKGRPISVYTSSNYEKGYVLDEVLEEPTESLELEWVHGYRGKDRRQNMYIVSDELIYFIGALVVLFDVKKRTQRHYCEHNDDVSCLNVHHGKSLAVSGQVAGHHKKEGESHVRVWNVDNLETLHVVGLGFFSRSVSNVAFSLEYEANYLFVIDDSNDHVLSVWSLSDGKLQLITESNTSQSAILGVAFNPAMKFDGYDSKKEAIAATCGKGHLGFWIMEDGCLDKKQGIFGKNPQPKATTCIAFKNNGQLLSGDSNGSLFLWGPDTSRKNLGVNQISTALVKSHDGCIFAILPLEDGTCISGGDDRLIVWHDKNLNKIAVINQVPANYGAIRCLCPGLDEDNIYIGTTWNCILEYYINMDSKNVKQIYNYFIPIIMGHRGELWGLATHPRTNLFASASHDGGVCIWYASEKEDSESYKPPRKQTAHRARLSNEVPSWSGGAHACEFHPDGEVLAVGCLESFIVFFDVETMNVISHIELEVKKGQMKEAIACIAYSPNGDYLAVGSRDNNIYIVNVSKKGRTNQQFTYLEGHSSFITHLDWSMDGKYIRSNSGDYEILYWCHDKSENNQDDWDRFTSSSELRDTKWATHNCTLSFNTCGIWPENADGTDVNACTVSQDGQLVASADDFGKVNLYRYPADHIHSKSHSYGGHSSHVTNVKFMNWKGHKWLFSSGGRDTSIIQWKIVTA